MSRLREIVATWQRQKELILMGAYRPGNDPLIDEAVARRNQVLDFLRQSAKSQIDIDASIAALQAEFGA